MTRRLSRLAAVLATAALAAGAVACSDDPGTAGGASTPTVAPARADVILDWFPNADHAGLFAAVEEGFFDEESLAVTPQTPADPAASLKQVAAGKAAFALSYEPEVLIARSRGIPVKAVGALVTAPLNAVLARRDRGITRPRDLEGRTVGVAGVPSDRPLLDAVVRHDGGDPKKVRVKTIGFTLAPALAAGKVDATIGSYWNVEAVELREKGVDLAVFRLEEHGVPTYDEIVVVTSDDIARDDPEAVRRFLSGLAAGQAWAVANQAAAVAHVTAANADLDPALTAESLRLVAPLLDPPGGEPLALDPARWEAFAAWMRDNGLLDAPVDAREAVTDEFLPKR